MYTRMYSMKSQGVFIVPLFDLFNHRLPPTVNYQITSTKRGGRKVEDFVMTAVRCALDPSPTELGKITHFSC